mmetsp:Transcript_15016/g.44504  ORF Transcript_15016/g.44504 Transcript_15016/m.44504 type:complete len:293 (+) Transcript_15016:1126-2004(+)
MREPLPEDPGEILLPPRKADEEPTVEDLPVAGVDGVRSRVGLQGRYAGWRDRGRVLVADTSMSRCCRAWSRMRGDRDALRMSFPISSGVRSSFWMNWDFFGSNLPPSCCSRDSLLFLPIEAKPVPGLREAWTVMCLLIILPSVLSRRESVCPVRVPKHGVHTRRSLDSSMCLSRSLFFEQAPQTARPQFRQWCLRRITEKVAPQDMHAGTAASGVQIGATSARVRGMSPVRARTSSMHLVMASRHSSASDDSRAQTTKDFFVEIISKARSWSCTVSAGAISHSRRSMSWWSW